MPGRLSKLLPGAARAVAGVRAGPRLLALALAGTMAGCTVPPPAAEAPPRTSEAAPAQETGRTGGAGPLRIALLVPRSGESTQAATLGRALADAARLALDEAGQVWATLRVYDTRGRPETAAAAAGTALEEGADLVLGPLFAHSTRAVGAAVAGRGVAVLSFSNDSAVAGGPVWITGYTPEAEARHIVAHAGRRGIRRIAVFRPDTEYGAKALAGARAAGGTRLAPVASYERSFRGIERASGGFAESARLEGAGAVLLPAGGDELKTVASFLNYHALDPENVRYLGLRKWQSAASFEEPALRGGWFAAPDPDRAADFAARLRAATGAPAPALAHLGHDAMAVALTLAAGSGGAPPFTRRALTAPQGFEGALGRLRFGPDQVAERALAVLSVGAGEFVPRAPARLPFAGGS